jgi:murein DD-endopeptidase MepM/ murein hydrolase activator NlpD
VPSTNLPKPAVGDWGDGYGWRTLPDGTRNFHNGRDLTWFNRDPEGSQKVYSPVDGVAVVGSNSLIGNFVSLPIGDGYSTRLCHFAELAITNGQKVTRGQYLGRMGNTGSQAFGIHLHVDVFGPTGIRVDPALYYTNTFVGTLTTAGGETTPIGDDDMPLTDEDKDFINRAVAAGVQQIKGEGAWSATPGTIANVRRDVDWINQKSPTSLKAIHDAISNLPSEAVGADLTGLLAAINAQPAAFIKALKEAL